MINLKLIIKQYALYTCTAHTHTRTMRGIPKGHMSTSGDGDGGEGVG